MHSSIAHQRRKEGARVKSDCKSSWSRTKWQQDKRVEKRPFPVGWRSLSASVMRDLDFFVRRNRTGYGAAARPPDVDLQEDRMLTEPVSTGGDTVISTLGNDGGNDPGSVEMTDRDVLLHLFRTTGGESWKFRDGWAENAADLSAWYGVATDEEGRVVELELRGEYSGLRFTGNKLVGVIPPEIGQLEALKKLDLTGNKLSGAVPSELGQLGALEHLMLPHNELSGPIPPELGKLSALKRLSLAGNYISGAIPPDLGELTSMEQLNLYLNDLRGQIPPELCRLRSLQKLFLSRNRLDGTIPPELGGLSALKTIYLSRNQLSGTIPTELGRLSALEGLDLAWNNLQGLIPSELGGLGALQRLALTGNKLFGAIPSELRHLTSLKGLYLGENKLSGAIPVELSELPALKALLLSGNELVGTIPKELGSIPGLRLLHVDDNKFTSLGEAKDALWLLRRLSRGYLPDLKNNPWIMPPEAVVEKGGAVYKYLLDVEKAEEAGARVEMLQLLKVVLVGCSKAGKTSLMRSIVSGRESPTKGTPAEVSTVGIELLRHRLKGTTVEFYDCAGQVDYAGMHQTFLSRRALYLLVWDVGRCLGREGDDLDEVIIEDIMQWLFALHLRAPGSTVMLVANKCDGGSTDDFAAIVDKVKRRATDLLREWQAKRGIQSDAHLRVGYMSAWGVRTVAAVDSADMGPGATATATTPRRRVADVTLLSEPSLVSCLDGSGLANLIDRVAGQGAISISVPPAWGLALKVIDALRGGQDPLQVARQHLLLSSSPPREGPLLADGDQHGSRGFPQSKSPFVTRAALTGLWKGIVKAVEAELKSPAAKMAVCNPENALEGALWISEYAGQTLSVTNCDGIFVDAVWISTALKPILSHKLEREVFPAHLANMRDELVHDGVLRRELAEHLWSREMGGPLMAEGVVRALCQVIVDLGVALPLPLDPASSLAADGGTSPVSSHGNSGGLDLLVIMRLPETCSLRQQGKLDALLASLRSGHQQRRRRGQDVDASGGPVLRKEVALKWRFDWAGPPRGLVERLIASCHAIGKVEQGLCWRYGAVFKSHAVLAAGENEPGGRLYTILLRYDKTIGDESRVLSMRLFGPLEDLRVWAAVRWVASAMISVSRDWPGVLWEGWPECAEGHTERAYFVTPDKANVGDLLLPDAAPTGVPRACDCRNIEGGVLRLVLERLGNVVDTQRGDPFAGLPNTEVDDEEDQQPKETASQCHNASARCCYNCGYDEALRIWLPSDSHAGQAAGGFWTAALTFLGAAVTLKETDTTGWRICLAFMGLFLAGAAVATVYACRHHVRKARRARRDQAVFRRRGGRPLGMGNAQDRAASFA